jgi:hypothetical protein
VSDWKAATLEGGVNANLQKIMDALKNAGHNADTAKVIEGTDQNGKPICAIFTKS